MNKMVRMIVNEEDINQNDETLDLLDDWIVISGRLLISYLMNSEDPKLQKIRSHADDLHRAEDPKLGQDPEVHFLDNQSLFWLFKEIDVSH